MTSNRIDGICGAHLFFKCENFQRAGAFKARGAFNAVMSLTAAQAKAGVVTHSSGNHAAALALAARTRGIPAHIVMPDNSSEPKKAAVRGYGANITFCEPTLPAREASARTTVETTGGQFIHPYDDPRIIAGQATAAVELLGDVHGLNMIMCPVGGGGLLAGTALAARWLDPDVEVVGAEPAAADDAIRSFQSRTLLSQGPPTTIADGLRTSLGKLNFRVILGNVDQMVPCSEASIVEAMRLIWLTMKLIIEPSAAVPLGAILENPSLFAGKRLGVILSGGNVDIDRLPWSGQTQ
jgi:threonine dehydratase